MIDFSLYRMEGDLFVLSKSETQKDLKHPSIQSLNKHYSATKIWCTEAELGALGIFDLFQY